MRDERRKKDGMNSRSDGGAGRGEGKTPRRNGTSFREEPRREGSGRPGRPDRQDRPDQAPREISGKRPERPEFPSGPRPAPGAGARERSGGRTARAELIRQDPLFPRLLPAVREALDRDLFEALQTVFPLRAAHRRDLPRNIVALSRLLTVNRAELRRPYWASPGYTGAYLHYFLPWNVCRLARLFAGLALPPPPEEGRHLVADLGSGPLTLPLALWLACPSWRARKLVILAVDSSGHPLRLGRDLLRHLAERAGLPPWEIHLRQGSVEKGLREAFPLVREGARPWLVTAANVLNELPPARRRGLEEMDSPEDPDGEGGAQEDDLPADPSRLEELAAAAAALLRRGPAGAGALFVEPGTRLGWTSLMGLRDAALDQGLRLTGPCPHGENCPLRRGGDEDLPGALPVSRLAGRSWCHATFAREDVPAWLAGLTESAGFARESLSLAWLRFAGGEEESRAVPEDPADEGVLPLRILSHPLLVPGRAGRCRYACSPLGLVLLEDAQDADMGSLLRVKVGGEELSRTDRDARSGALCLRLVRRKDERRGISPDREGGAGRRGGVFTGGRKARSPSGQGPEGPRPGGSGRPDRGD